MNTHKFTVEEIRFHMELPDTLVFVGWFYDGITRNHTLTVQLDGKELPTVKLINQGVEVCQKYVHCVNEISEEVVGIAKLPENWREGHKLSIRSTFQGKAHKDAVYSVGKLKKLENRIRYSIDNVQKKDGRTVVSGWCVGNGELKVSLLNKQKQPLNVKIDHFYKKDPERLGPEDEKREKMFFSILTEETEAPAYLEIRNAKGAAIVGLNHWNDNSLIARILRKFKKAFAYFKQNGMKATLVRIRARLGLDGNRAAGYGHWLETYGLKEQELEEQRKEQGQLMVRPKFSVAVPLYRTDEKFLRELIISVQNQTYENWELCLADGSEDSGERLSAIVSEYQKSDSRIRYRILEKNYGISGNLNAAMEMAEGDFVTLVDHDDLLAPNALFEFAKACSKDPSTEVLYSDEDKVDATGEKFFEPHFKPDYDIDLLLTNNYICHLFAVKRSLLECVGGYRSEYDGSQDYDLILRCCEAAKKVTHVPKVLYHWRCHFESTSANPQSKLYAFEAGRRAAEAHYQRLGIPAEVEHAQFNGLYATRYKWQQHPLVSVIIPNTDQVQRLSRCVESVCHSEYSNYEILIADCQSVQKETFAYYEKLTKERSNIRVFTYNGEKGKAGVFEEAVKKTAGDYLLFLHPDIEMMNGKCMGEMLGPCMREDVGIVGAKILNEDATLYHAGIVLGLSGMLGYAFRGKSRYFVGYQSRAICAQDYSAVSGLCMMVKRSVFEETGGITEEFSNFFWDVDLCLKTRKAGYLVVYQPSAELLYCVSGKHEAGTPAGETRELEQEHFLKQWGKVIEAGDPYYNPNLTLEKLDFSLRR